MLTSLNTHNGGWLWSISVGKEVFGELVEFEVIVSVGLLFGAVGSVEEEAFFVEDY